MLDTFEILTTSGVVVWSKTYAPINPSIINNFIADTFIEEKGASALRDARSGTGNSIYKTDQHTLKWTMVKELGVIFVVGSSPVPLAPILGADQMLPSGCIPFATASLLGGQAHR